MAAGQLRHPGGDRCQYDLCGASDHSPTGVFADDEEYFASVGVVNGPLRALSSSSAGGNGVYLYGEAAVSDEVGNAANYWVDVVFNTSVTETIPPTVIKQSPGINVTGVDVATICQATFSEQVQAGTISFTLRDPDNVVPATLAYDDTTLTASLDARLLRPLRPRTRQPSAA